MIDGRLHAGAANAAGELGFLDLDAEPDPQGTDKEGAARTPTMGPFERQVGAAAIIDLAIAEARRQNDTELLTLMQTAQPHDDATALFDAAAAGNPLAQTIIDTICARLARGLAAVYLVLDPELVVIGGGLSRAGDQLLTAIQRHLRPRTLVPPRLALSALGDTAVAIGALRSALDDVDDRVLTALSFSD
jgi:predicted NBD/HSP70 family sugar kinase